MPSDVYCRIHWDRLQRNLKHKHSRYDILLYHFYFCNFTQKWGKIFIFQLECIMFSMLNIALPQILFSY